MKQNLEINVATKEVNPANSQWLSGELDSQEMASLIGGAVAGPIIRRAALNRWLFQLQSNTINLANVTNKVTTSISDATNRQANLNLTNLFYTQLTALQGGTNLANRLYQAIGLPIPGSS